MGGFEVGGNKCHLIAQKGGRLNDLMMSLVRCLEALQPLDTTYHPKRNHNYGWCWVDRFSTANTFLVLQ